MLFSIICLCDQRGDNCEALKEFLEQIEDAEAVIQPATEVLPEIAKAVAPSLSRGEFGCYLSHMQALQTFLQSQHQVGGTLEDDLHFTDKSSAVAKVMAAASEIHTYHSAHIINLDPDWQGHSCHVKREFMYTAFPGLNASFIMYSRNGAAAWFAALQYNAQKMHYLLPVDNLFKEAGVACAVPIDTPFYQRKEQVGAFASSIDDCRLLQYKAEWKEKIPDFITYYYFRLYMLTARSILFRTLLLMFTSLIVCWSCFIIIF